MLTISSNYQSLQTQIKDYRSPEDQQRMNAVEDLELQLNAAISLRDQLRKDVEASEAELTKTFEQNKLKKPRESIAEIDSQIRKLEKERETNSMPLAAERDILKQIYKLTKLKNEAIEFEIYDTTVKEKKEAISSKRNKLRELGQTITELKIKHDNVKTAATLGCDVTKLVGRKIECPVEKLGQIIGKKGKHISELKEKANVDVNVVKNGQGDIRLVGTIDSLDAATSRIDRTLTKTEEAVTVSENFVLYLTSKNIVALANIRQLFVDSETYCNVVREKKTEITIRGIPENIAQMKEKFKTLESNLVTKTMNVTNKDSALIVGKNGTTIENLVKDYQVMIDVNRQEGDNVIITLVGDSQNVEKVFEIAKQMIDANKDGEIAIPTDANLKNALLAKNGHGMQALQKKVGEAIRQEDTVITPYVGLSFSAEAIVIKGKNKFLNEAKTVVQREVDFLESISVTLDVDPIVIPTLMGKGGSYMKHLKEAYETVAVHLDRVGGKVQIHGLQKGDITKVSKEIQDTIAENMVERIYFENFEAQFRDLMRYKSKDIRELVFIMSDEAKSQVVVRGEPEKVKQASSIISTFLENNFTSELQITPEDVSSLLTGGKQSKIAEFAKSSGINLSTDRDRNVIIGKGKKDAVEKAFKTVRQYLYGGEGIGVVHIKLEDDQMAIVIGRGGKNKKDLQDKYANVSIVVSRTESILILRGPSNDVETCRIEVLRNVISAPITRTCTITDSKKFDEAKFKQKLVREGVPVQVTVTLATVSFRGTADNVQFALAIFKETTEGIYESHIAPGAALFKRIKESCRDPTYFDRISKESAAKVILDDKKQEILVSGKRRNVKTAKEQLLKFFDFLYGANFCNLPIPVGSTLAKSKTIEEVFSQSGGPKIILDRDLNSLLLFDADSTKVQKAADLLKAKVSVDSGKLFVFNFEPSDDAILSSLIGKKGANIKKIRNDTGCKIDISSEQRTVVVSADEEETAIKGKLYLEEFIGKLRKEKAYISMSAKDISAFVGSGGSNIKQFTQKFSGIDVQVLKEESRVLLQGKEEMVTAAKSDIEEWIKSRESTAQEKTQQPAEEKMKVRSDQIPAIIGTKGAVIRGLEKEFGCKIDIDRVKSIITIRRGEPEKQKALTTKIKAIIDGEVDSETMVSSNDKTDATPSEASEIKEVVTETKTSEKKTKAFNNVKEFVSKNDEFPPLEEGMTASMTTNSDAEKADHSQISNPPSFLVGPSWASIVNCRSATSSMDDCEAYTIASMDNVPETPLDEEEAPMDDEEASMDEQEVTVVSGPSILLERKYEDHYISILETSKTAFVGDVTDVIDDDA